MHPSGTLAGRLAPLEAGLARLEATGCAVRWDAARARSSWRGYLAGDDRARLDELCDALVEPGVDIVWCARGGSGAARFGEAARARLSRVPPRALVGFSDVTSLLNMLATHLGWVCFHGPVVTSLAHPAIETDLDGILAVLRGERIRIPFRPTAGEPVSGRLCGGNLTVLASTIGTPMAPRSLPSDIWLLEDVNEPPYRLDRTLWQLRASVLVEPAAIWLGNLALPDDACQQAEAMFRDDAPCPVIPHAPAGHRGRLDLLPIGGAVTLDPTAGLLSARAPWVHRAARNG